ncbi:hypothetical protein B0J17DRAFT_659974 [Rhizoctonia solani]|nr:hypothetical protein B0J17DRAFT_659974 [Rhizoctonia solani]
MTHASSWVCLFSRVVRTIKVIRVDLGSRGQLAAFFLTDRKSTKCQVVWIRSESDMGFRILPCRFDRVPRDRNRLGGA